MSNWHHIDIEELSGPHKEDLDGVEITVYWSNDDIPRFAKSEISGGELAVKFRYDHRSTFQPIDERLKTESCDSVLLIVGQKSKRLYEVRVRATDAERQSIQKIQETLERYSERRFNSPSLKDNAQAVGEAFRRVAGNLQ